MRDSLESERFDVMAFGAHPDDLEVVMVNTAAKLAHAGQSILFVDLGEGEPARHAVPLPLDLRGLGRRRTGAASHAAPWKARGI